MQPSLLGLMFILALLPRQTSGADAFFERMTESALRSLFFARASVEGDVIDVQHLLSGIARGGNDLTREMLTGKRLELPDGPSLERELPFSVRCRRALRFAMQEAETLGHTYVASEHLLLGVLREGFTVEGLTLETVRELVRTRSQPEPVGKGTIEPASGSIKPKP